MKTVKKKTLVSLCFLKSRQPQLALKIGLGAVLSQLEANLRQLEANLRPTGGSQAGGGQSGGVQSGGGQNGATVTASQLGP